AKAAGELTALARKERRPGVLEAVTYRWRGHVGPDENIDVGLRRKAEDLEAWKKRDPVARLFRGMEEKGFITRDAYDRLVDVERARIAKETARAEDAPCPPVEALLGAVYAKGNGR